MKIRNNLALILLFLLASQSNALYKVDYPYFRDLKELHYETRLKDTWQLLFREDVKLARVNFNGHDYLVTEAVTEGKTKEDGKIWRRTVSHYLIEGDALTAFSHQAVTSREGRASQSFQIDYDWAGGNADFFLLDEVKNKPLSKQIKLKENVIFSRDTTILFPSLIARRAREQKFRVMLPTGNTFDLRAQFSYIPEDFDIGGRQVECYRVSLQPNSPILALVAPNINFWYLAAPPYNFVRYEGPLAGPFSPTVIQEQVF